MHQKQPVPAKNHTAHPEKDKVKRLFYATEKITAENLA